MEWVAFLSVTFALLPLAIGVLAGEPRAWWVWTAIALALVVLQASSGEVEAFAWMIAFLGSCGFPFVMAGLALRRRFDERRRRSKERAELG